MIICSATFALTYCSWRNVTRLPIVWRATEVAIGGAPRTYRRRCEEESLSRVDLRFINDFLRQNRLREWAIAFKTYICEMAVIWWRVVGLLGLGLRSQTTNSETRLRGRLLRNGTSLGKGCKLAEK